MADRKGAARTSLMNNVQVMPQWAGGSLSTVGDTFPTGSGIVYDVDDRLLIGNMAPGGIIQFMLVITSLSLGSSRFDLGDDDDADRYMDNVGTFTSSDIVFPNERPSIRGEDLDSVPPELWLTVRGAALPQGAGDFRVIVAYTGFT